MLVNLPIIHLKSSRALGTLTVAGGCLAILLATIAWSRFNAANVLLNATQELASRSKPNASPYVMHDSRSGWRKGDDSGPMLKAIYSLARKHCVEVSDAAHRFIQSSDAVLANMEWDIELRGNYEDVKMLVLDLLDHNVGVVLDHLTMREDRSRLPSPVPSVVRAAIRIRQYVN